MSQFNNKLGSTDVVFQSISVFIEGVQVPFIAVSISSNFASLPTASVQVPIQSGLMDIVRYYQPKIHVFYKDPINDTDCLLFSGVIHSVSYQKSMRGSGSSSIVFSCLYKYYPLTELTLDFSGYTSDANQLVSTDGNAEVKMNIFNSLMSISQAMSGITGIDPAIEPSKENIEAGIETKATILRSDYADYRKRLMGMPGVMMNYWNQLMMMGYSDPKRYKSLTTLYGPLVEIGLKFFNRLSGHYYIESKIDNTKIDPCPGTTSPEDSDRKLVAPSMRLFLNSAVQADMALKLKDYLGQYSGESTSLFKIFKDFVDAIDYDLIFLTSPAEVPLDPTTTDKDPATYAVDTIIKPQLPFYYSPACNVILPNMYSDLNVSQNESEIPTRVTATQDLLSGTGRFGINYRAPASIREAIAKGSKDNGNGYDVKGSTGSFYGRFGKFEQGRGIKHSRILMPNWLAYYAKSMDNSDETNASTDALNENEKQWLEILKKAWEDRYAERAEDGTITNNKANMNPWSPEDSHINSFERILFATAEYRYTMEVASSKAGSVECIFNPYIVPGYPMDILSSSRVEPSFHAMCNSVTHSISSRSIGTSVSFVGAITYTELANYYLQFIHPWLQTALAIVNMEDGVFHTSILYNNQAKSVADEFYKSTLGVPARAPNDMFDFNTESIRPIGIGSSQSSFTTKGAQLNPNLTAMGNLRLAYRPIETRSMVEERQGIKFIDMSPGNYNPTVVRYTDEVLTNSKLLEPGQSQFLQYREYY